MVEYGIIIESFKTEEEAKKTMTNICDEMHMEESIFHVKPVLDREGITAILHDDDHQQSMFVLNKDTAIMCLYEIMSSAFCAYHGDKELFKDTSKFEDADLLKITEDDWKDIGVPWNDLEPCMKSYYEILNQSPKEWFTSNE